jgi:hypothetical protein
VIQKFVGEKSKAVEERKSELYGAVEDTEYPFDTHKPPPKQLKKAVQKAMRDREKKYDNWK